MPEFCMEGRDHMVRAESEFVAGFLEASFFASMSQFDSENWNDPETQDAIAEGRSDGELPRDASYCHIDKDDLIKVREYCDRFQKLNRRLLTRAYKRNYDEMQSGRDFYFTRAGHGVGYWSRDELESRGLGSALTESCGSGEVNPYAEVIGETIKVFFYLS